MSRWARWGWALLIAWMMVGSMYVLAQVVVWALR